MHVELLYHTPDPERAIATAARLCYAPVGAAELMETMPPERIKSVLTTIMSSGHFSTLEHASYTFAVDGVSRALTHQLVRHRIASFNQQSQRYVKFTGEVAVVTYAAVISDTVVVGSVLPNMVSMPYDTLPGVVPVLLWDGGQKVPRQLGWLSGRCVFVGGYWPVMMRTISWSVSRIPSRPRRPTLRMVSSTPFWTMPSPP